MQQPPNLHPVIVDWKWPTQRIVETADLEGSIATYWRGMKWQAWGVTPVDHEAPHTPSPGTVLTAADGPIHVATGDGCVRLEHYAVELHRNTWLWQDRFLSVFQKLGRDPVQEPIRFVQVRFPDWDSIVYRFEALLRLKEMPADGRIRYTYLDSDDLYLTNRAFLFRLFERLDLKPGQRFLDVGCSGLPWTCRIAHEYGLEAYGCDVHAEENFPDYPWMTYFRGDVSEFPDLPVPFDLVFARGLTPLAYARTFDYPQLTRFKQKLLEGLTPTGSFYWVHMSNNTGRRRDEDDFGHLGIPEMIDWIGREFRHCRCARSNYISLLATNGTLRTWKDLTPEQDDQPHRQARCWRKLKERRLSMTEYLHILLCIVNRMWEPMAFRTDLPVRILGGGELADDLALVLKTVCGDVRFLGVFDAPQPGEAPCFSFVLPAYDGPAVPDKQYRLTYAELNLLVGSQYYDCVDASHDAACLLTRILPAFRARAQEKQKAQQAAKPNPIRTIAERVAAKDWPGLLSHYTEAFSDLGPKRRITRAAVDLLLFGGMTAAEAFLQGLDGLTDDDLRRMRNDLRRTARRYNVPVPPPEGAATDKPGGSDPAAPVDTPSGADGATPPRTEAAK